MSTYEFADSQPEFKESRGPGIGQPFSGSSTTGEMAATGVFACGPDLDLLLTGENGKSTWPRASGIEAEGSTCLQWKYIGETEKNLGRLFDAVEGNKVTAVLRRGRCPLREEKRDQG